MVLLYLNKEQGTKIFQYYSCPAGRVTYTCPLKVYAIKIIRE